MTVHSSSADRVLVRKQGPVTIVSINRPEVRNAVDRATAEDLAAAFREFDRDPDAAVAILTGEGGTFCAGADLKAVAAGDPNRFASDGDAPMGVSRMRLSKPVIAALSGHAVAGGLELALWADLRVADENTVLGVFCRRWGVPLIDGGTVRLPRVIGLGHAMDLILTGRPVSAQEAQGMGLVNRVAPAGRSLATAVQLAEQLAAFPQTCMRQDRLSALEQEGLGETEALANEYEHGVVSISTDTLAGATRFAGGAGRHGSFTDIGNPEDAPERSTQS
ncbi:crotonase/enoyl-CoA hydratase family protein [Nocardia cyriacigeorgica]|uniref:crotonase/enoyl-CoA hydratase family protein n=1 Tax=Nocardia cyriacigeorgica TaxID=135487 RepID=UPI0024583FD9|nr:crotonase/enoyl-CoA hydratase family protein [Nocardia cyriacigeorgica]BDU06776.1 enoyl-CoA hydratase [Nocardia cyriacigeorgica]